LRRAPWWRTYGPTARPAFRQALAVGQFDDALPDRDGDSLSAILHSQLLVNVPQVGLDRLLAQGELGRDEPIAQAIGEQTQYLALPLRETELPARPPHAISPVSAPQGDSGGHGWIDGYLAVPYPHQLVGQLVAVQRPEEVARGSEAQGFDETPLGAAAGAPGRGDAGNLHDGGGSTPIPWRLRAAHRWRKMLTSLTMGTIVAYYLAICYGVDPSAEPQIKYLNEQLG